MCARLCVPSGVLERLLLYLFFSFPVFIPVCLYDICFTWPIYSICLLMCSHISVSHVYQRKANVMEFDSQYHFDTRCNTFNVAWTLCNQTSKLQNKDLNAR